MRNLIPIAFLLVATAGNAQTTTLPGHAGITSWETGTLSSCPCAFDDDSAGNLRQVSDTLYRDTVNAKALILNRKDTTLQIINIICVRHTNFCGDKYKEEMFYDHIYTEDMKTFFPLDQDNFIKVIWQAAYPDHPHTIRVIGL